MCDEEKLADLLDDLTDEELNTFKWHLKKETWNGNEPIKPAKLQKAERLDVVDLMVQKYKLDGAVTVMVILLKKISRNDLVVKLTGMSPAAAAAGLSPAASSNSSVDQLTSARSNFVTKVSMAVLQQLLDRMLENKILNDAELELAGATKADKARAVIDMVRNKGSKASTAFIVAMCDLDPCLAEELKLK